MKRFYIFYFLFAFIFQTNAQSVFDCNTYTKHISQSEINATQTINGTCVIVGDNGAIHLQNSDNKSIFASNSITLKDNVHLGGFDLTGGVHLKITSKTELNIAVMNYNDLYGVLRYKKLEFGIELPDNVLTRINYFLHNKGVHSDELNPFLEWNIDVEGVFQHVQTGKTVKVDGFYTREYTENPNTDDWDDIGTIYPFRVRFAPPENGEWKAYVTIRLKNGQELGYQSADFMFNVVESGDPGYVKVHENKRNLKQGDRMIIPTGMNFVSPDNHAMAWGEDNHYIGTKLFSSNNTEKACNTKEWENYRQSVEQYFQDGGRYIKTIQLPWSSLIEFEEKGNYYKRLHYAWEQDKLLDLCDQYDALLIFDFMYQVTLEKSSTYGMYFWDWDYYMKHDVEVDPSHLPSKNDTLSWFYDFPAYCYNDDPSWRSSNSIHYGTKKPYETFTNESDLAYHKQRIRYYIARYGYSTKIYEFEIQSEPWNLNAVTWSKNDDSIATRSAIYNYHKVISECLRDSLSINQLIGIDIAYTDAAHVEESVSLPKIDIVGTNPYYIAPDFTYKMFSFVQGIQQKHGSLIPVILSEGGVDEAYQACSNHTQHAVEMMSMPFTGVAGFFPWVGWEPKTHYLWPVTIRAQQHMNGDDVINTLSEGGGDWVHGKQEEKLFLFINSHQTNFSALEHQYYLSSNKNYSVGYVKNRTYNVHTKRLNDYCDLNYGNTEPIDDLENIKWNDVRLLPLNRRLRVQGLSKNTKYRVDYYSFETGNHLSTQCDKTPLLKGELVLKYNELTANPSGNELLNPVIWYVIIKNGCPQGREVEESSDSLTLKSDVLTISTENIEEQLLVFPNPFNNYITIVSNKEDELTIITVDGRISKKVLIPKGNTTIYTADLASGVYILFFARQLVQTKMIKP